MKIEQNEKYINHIKMNNNNNTNNMKINNEIYECGNTKSLYNNKKCKNIISLSLQNDFPIEILMNIISFAPITKICKSWTKATNALTRKKFRMNLNNILMKFTQQDKANELSDKLEISLYYICNKRVSRFYGIKARQILFNLKDNKNKLLCKRLITGDITSHSLIHMNGSDMANPELIELRQNWKRQRIIEVTRNNEELDATETDIFICPSCHSKRTRYRQWRRKAIVDRTRIIVICSDCPYRWDL